jgi:hypothetical protein
MHSNKPKKIPVAEPHTRRLIPVPDWPKYHAWPPIGGLRHLIFNEKTNGFARAFKRVGRSVLIDEQAFFQIVDEKNGGEK